MDNGFKIGAVALRNKIVSAPMAGVSDIAYRYVAHKMGAGLTVTEMATGRGLVQRQKRTLNLIRTYADARPYSAQIFGNDPKILGEAAKIVEECGAEIVDLNAACPVKKVIRSHSGADMLNDLPRLAESISEMKKAVKIPVTVKIRAGWNSDNIFVREIVQTVETAGADAITLHPRTVSQGFGGKADWRLIAEAVDAVKIPVIASGDIASPEDARIVLSTTGCAAIMIGRAAIGNPFLFGEIAAAIEGREALPTPSFIERHDLALEQLEILLNHYDRLTAAKLWRKHLCWYSRGVRYSAKFRSKIFAITDVDKLKEIAMQIFEIGDFQIENAETVNL